MLCYKIETLRVTIEFYYKEKLGVGLSNGDVMEERGREVDLEESEGL